MKAAPVMRALSLLPQFRQTLVHTGQHYDSSMSEVFFKQLGLPKPDVNLEVGSATHAQQAAQVMIGFEKVISKFKPDLVMVYGDVNSSMAAALVAAKLGIRVAHVEAGLRSFDRSMPEEINRLLIDQLSDFLFTPSMDGNENLAREGILPSKVFFVGNVMIDTLVSMLSQTRSSLPESLPDRYVLVTLHRPSNVDALPWLGQMLHVLHEISNDLEVLFPVHPRTRQRLREMGAISSNNGRLRLLEPVPYVEFLALQTKATAVITDSGGIQEETTYLGIPCLTVRENTERPITVNLGTNVLVGRNLDALATELNRILKGETKPAQIPPLWDGRAADRIANLLTKAV